MELSSTPTRRWVRPGDEAKTLLICRGGRAIQQPMSRDGRLGRQWLGRAAGLLLSLVFGESAAVAETRTAPAEQASRAGQPDAAGPAWPKYFTVERQPAGALLADGRKVTASELSALAARAVSSGQFSGAAVFAEGELERRELVVTMNRSGFRMVRSAPRRLPAALGYTGAAVMAATAKESGVMPAATPQPSVSAATVNVVTVGLHIGGASYDGTGRKQLVRRFEDHFGAFQGCHALAPGHSQNASFGVDLLVPTTGGRARVRQIRTRLDGGAFRTCMKQAFEAIQFEAPPTKRPEHVSYSLLFKPVAGSLPADFH